MRRKTNLTTLFLAPPGLAAAYPRYPAPGGSQPPFGGLGLPAMVPSSHSAPSGHTIAGQHARPGPLGPPPLASVGSPMDPRYAGYRPQTTSQAAWPLKSESSLLNHKEKERREEEDKVRRERREAEDRRMREEAQRARERRKQSAHSPTFSVQFSSKTAVSRRHEFGVGWDCTQLHAV